MSKKIRPTIFLKAAKMLEKNLEDKSYGNWGLTCCDVFTDLLGWCECEDSLEFKLFKKMFANKRSEGVYWFGSPYCKDEFGNASRVNPTNQNKRIKALYKAHKAAVKLKGKV